MKRKKSEFELALEVDQNFIRRSLKADQEALEADRNHIRKSLEADQETIRRALEIPGWSKADVNKSVNEFMTEQTQRKPRKPISKGLAMRLMARAQGKCENCGKNLYNEKIEIHHKNYEPTDPRESNLMVVCRPCHKKLTGPRPVI